jgi:HD superfamily phosphohydrolase
VTATPDQSLSGGILEPGEFVAESVYQVAELLGSGNSGEVYRLENPKHGRNRVFKIFIPYYELRQAQIGQEGRGELTNQIIENAHKQPYQQREYKFLSVIDHPFIVKVHDFGVQALSSGQLGRLRAKTAETFSGPSASLPYLIAAFVPGSSFIEGLGDQDRRTALRAMRCLAEALDHLHVEHDYMHLDVKSANVRVRPDGYPALVDFALSQDLSPGAVELGDSIIGGIDWDLLPFRRGSSGIADFVQHSQTQGVSRAEFKARFFPWIDFYQFGLLLKAAFPAVATSLTPAESAYLRMLLDELTDWDRVTRLHVGELRGLVRRIDATRFFLAIRPGSMSGGREVPLSNGRAVFVPPSLLPIVEHPEMTRLNRLNQLSLLPSRFCGATHSRFEHSLDVLRLAQSAARRLLDVPACRYIFDEADIEALLLAAVLHDINHLPLTHLYQESGLPFLRKIDLFTTSLRAVQPAAPCLQDVVTTSTALKDPDRLLRLVEGGWQDQSGPRKEADQIISSLVNSGADLDKMSYLVMDSNRSGLGFASGISPGSLLAFATVVRWEKRDANGTSLGEGWHLAFRSEALPLLESMATARARGFEELYWCDDNRAMMSLFLASIRSINNAPGGVDALRDLMLSSRGETDFAVLQRIDSLSHQLVGDSRHLSLLFDSISGTRPNLVYASGDHYDAIRRLSPVDREEFEAELREGLARKLPSIALTPGELMLDVPDRPLDLGGTILIDQNGVGVDALTLSPVLRAQRDRLIALSCRVRLFITTAPFSEWQVLVASDGRSSAEQWVGRTLAEALGGSSFR